MVTPNNGHLSSISRVIEKDDEKNEKVSTQKRDLLKKLGIYCSEYCDFTGIHGFKYFGERRTCFEK